MINSVHQFLFDSNVDIRDRLLCRSRITIVSILLLYILFVKALGPKLMKNRKAFELRKTILFYNTAQVVCNLYFTYQVFSVMYETWPKRCGAKMNPAYIFYEKKLKVVVWNIYLVKIGDLLDTVFFVLRKKERQITFLHTFHHIVVIVLMQALILQPKISYNIILAVGINVFIHCCTYTYYTLSILGPHMQKYLWWKRYLTEMQMWQFVIDLAYMTYSFASGCDEPDAYDLAMYYFLLAIFILLCNFYINSYLKNKK